MRACPSDEMLRALFEEDSLPPSDPAVIDHVRTCLSCQTRLDNLTQFPQLLGLNNGDVPALSPTFELLAKIAQSDPSELNCDAADERETLPPFPGPPTSRGILGQIGDFEIVKRLGGGAFGVVFLAYDRKLDAPVALKVLRGFGIDEGDHEGRFRQEARKAAAIRHENVVQVRRYEKPDHFAPYLVMDYVEGETLQAKLRREKRLLAAEVAGLGQRIALGLAAAHEAGVVHRDIKPSNILIESSSGQPRITDFGLARSVDEDATCLTHSDVLLGTVLYMSPEQVHSPRDVDGRADVYSLGVILYESLTGRRPIEGESTLQVIERLQKQEPISLRALTPGLPSDLETIVLGCLEKEPERRYPTARAVAEDLRRFLYGEPILRVRTGLASRLWRWTRREPIKAALVVVGCVAVLASVALAAGLPLYWETLRVKDEVILANRQLDTLQYAADMSLAQQAFVDGNVLRFRDLLAQHQKRTPAGFEWRHLNHLAQPVGVPFGPSNRVLARSVDPTCRWVAFCVEGVQSSAIEVWDMANPKASLPTQVFPIGSAKVHHIAYVSENVLAVGRSREEIEYWDLNRGGRVAFGDGPIKDVLEAHASRPEVTSSKLRKIAGTSQYALAADPKNGVVFVGSSSDSIRRYRSASGLPFSDPIRMELYGKPITSMAVSADGRKLVVGTGAYDQDRPNKNEGNVLVWNLAADRSVALSNSKQNFPISAVAISADGRWVAAASFDHLVRVWDCKTGALAFQVMLEAEPTSVAFSDDSKKLASCGYDGNVHVWEFSGRWQRLAKLGVSSTPMSSVHFAASGLKAGPPRLLLQTFDGKMRFWGLDTEHSGPVLKGSGQPILGLGFNRGGTRLVAVQGEPLEGAGALSVWDIGNRKLLPFEQFTGTVVSSANQDQVLQVYVDEPAPKHVLQSSGALAPKPGFIACETVTQAGARAIADENARIAILRPGQPNTTIDAGFSSHASSKHGPQTAKLLALALSPDASKLAAGYEDGSIRIFDVGSGRPLGSVLRGHKCRVLCLAFNESATRLASGSEDFSIKVWLVDAGRDVLTLTGHRGSVRSIVFAPGGDFLASGSDDGDVRLWLGSEDPVPNEQPVPQIDIARSSKLR